MSDVPDNKKIIETLRSLSDRFHKIGNSFAAERILQRARNQGKDNHPMYQKIKDDILTPKAISTECADGFEACVRLMKYLGANDVQIFECKKEDITS